MSNQLFWYTARSSGIIAWALLAGSMLWGLTLSTKVLGTRPRPNWQLDLHRFLGGAALVMIGVHLGSLVLDNFVHFGVVELLVPFTGSYRPTPVAWGIASFYLLVAVEITSLLRSRIPKRMWRSIHYLSFPLFAMTTIHSLTAGTDSTSVPLRAAVIVVTIGLTVLAVVRASQASEPRTPVASRRPA